jgi:hypothetical protein
MSAKRRKNDASELAPSLEKSAGGRPRTKRNGGQTLESGSRALPDRWRTYDADAIGRSAVRPRRADQRKGIWGFSILFPIFLLVIYWLYWTISQH